MPFFIVFFITYLSPETYYIVNPFFSPYLHFFPINDRRSLFSLLLSVSIKKYLYDIFTSHLCFLPKYGYWHRLVFFLSHDFNN